MAATLYWAVVAEGNKADVLRQGPVARLDCAQDAFSVMEEMDWMDWMDLTQRQS